MSKTLEKLKKALALHCIAEITPNLFICAQKSAGPVHPPSRQALEHPAPGVQDFLQSGEAFTVMVPVSNEKLRTADLGY